MSAGDDQPVTRHECALHRSVFETRFGTIERDLAEVKKDVGEIRSQLVDMRQESSAFYTDARSFLVWAVRLATVILILVAAGRGLDLSALAGGI